MRLNSIKPAAGSNQFIAPTQQLFRYRKGICLECRPVKHIPIAPRYPLQRLPVLLYPQVLQVLLRLLQPQQPFQPGQ